MNLFMEVDVEQNMSTVSSSSTVPPSYKQRRLALFVSAVKQVRLVTDDTCAAAHVS